MSLVSLFPESVLAPSAGGQIIEYKKVAGHPHLRATSSTISPSLHLITTSLSQNSAHHEVPQSHFCGYDRWSRRRCPRTRGQA